jgi:hypothetical protein
MKAEETDMRVIRILDGFIGKMKIRAEKANNPDATSSP